MPLETGNVVVTSPYDDAGGVDAGAVYLFDGTTGELISTLIGSSADNRIGSNGLKALKNGNYLVLSPKWDNGAATDAGAITFGNGITGVEGVVSATNSLVGSSRIDLVGAGTIELLENGNYVVGSSIWDNGSAEDAGAVTFGDGNNGVSGFISELNSLVGSSPGDGVGGALKLLPTGNYLAISSSWDDGLVSDVGAISFGDMNNGVKGVVSTANSLVGASSSDRIGRLDRFSDFDGVMLLDNGNYIVRSQFWDNGLARDAGAVTFGNGLTGVTGIVSSANSLVGSSEFDEVNSVTVLENGNYVVSSPFWDNGPATDAGAVTFGNGDTGISGVISAANSLIGSSIDDKVGINRLTLLANGNYVVRSPIWDNGSAVDAGAVTLGDGTSGVSGEISEANSLIGLQDDRVGSGDVTPLANGNYVVSSPDWDSELATDAGAVTFGDGSFGVFGTVDVGNSLVGSSDNDGVGSRGVTVLQNGNYVVRSPGWDNGLATNAGAVTFGDGTMGVTGQVNSSNSLVGNSADDEVGLAHVITLENGSYIVQSLRWDDGLNIDVGAVTFGNGTTGVSGAVTAANSLVGSSEYDRVGLVTALENGNYVVRSPSWDNGNSSDAGAVTFGNGTTGVSGVINAANSLIGSSVNDLVGSEPVIVLANGNFVVPSPFWDNGSSSDAGAVTFGDGTIGVTGAVNNVNSLVGSANFDRVGNSGIFVLENNNYVVFSREWDNGSIFNAGAFTFGNGNTGVAGEVSESNSLVGTSASCCRGATIRLLANSNYLIVNPNVDFGPVINAGAITFGDATSGVSGIASPSNSLTGSSSRDGLGNYFDSIVVLENGNYIVRSTDWDADRVVDAGAVTFGDAKNGGVIGEIDVANSILGEEENAGASSQIFIDETSDRFFAAFPNDGGGRVWVGSSTTGFAVIPISDAPAIRDVRIDGAGISQRPDQWQRLEVFFDHDVTITADALSMTNDSLGGIDVDLSGMTFEYDPIKFKATWTFDPASPLPAAFYTYSLDASLITANGLPLDGNSDGTGGDDFVAQHYVALPGDANLDGAVDVLNDAFTMVSNLGDSAQATWADGDFNGDGSINVLNDAFPLVSNLDKSIVPTEIVEVDRDQEPIGNEDLLERPDQIQTIQLDFSVDVHVESDDLVLYNQTTDRPVSLDGAAFSYDPISFRATWNLSALSTSMPAGYYSVSILASSVANSASGQTMLQDYSNEFYLALPGDANLDGNVNVLGDGFALVGNLGTSNPTWSDGDFNADGTVDVLGDGFILVGSLGESALPPSTVPLTTAISPETDNAADEEGQRDAAFAATDFAWVESEEHRKKRLAKDQTNDSKLLASSIDIDSVFQLS